MLERTRLALQPFLKTHVTTLPSLPHALWAARGVRYIIFIELNMQGTATWYCLFPDCNPRDDFQFSVLIHAVVKIFHIGNVQAGFGFFCGFLLNTCSLYPSSERDGLPAFAVAPWGLLFDWASWIPWNGVQTACVIKAAWEGWRAKLVPVGGHVFSSHRQRAAMSKIWQELVPKKNKTAPFFPALRNIKKHHANPHVEEMELLENPCDCVRVF